jgi:hypothetical protein
MKREKTYWIRWCFSEKGATDSRTFRTITAARKWAAKICPADCSFYYVMTKDPWGDCFVDCIRPLVSKGRA